MRRTFLSLFIACCSLFAATAQTADYNVVPLPQEIRIENGAGFELSGKTVIAYNGDKTMKRNAQLLAQYIKESTGLELKIVKSKKSKENAINLAIGNTVENKEGYNLAVTEKGIVITSPTAAGVFYGIQTLRKSPPLQRQKK